MRSLTTFTTSLKDVFSYSGLAIRIQKATTYKDIVKAFKEAAASKEYDIIGFTDEMVVSTDFVGSTYS